MSVDEKLMSWRKLGGAFKKTGLLVGNGASRSMDDRFSYRSLLEVASSKTIENPLTEDDLELFGLLRTENFEEVLNALRQAQRVCQQVGHEVASIRSRYRNIRTSFVEAVRAVHPAHSELSEKRLRKIRAAMSECDYVFTTNYDLIIYWMIMLEAGGKGFIDFFWNPDLAFDMTNTSVWGKPTKVLYLHGALHIYELADGETVKATGSEGKAWSTYTRLVDIGKGYRGVDAPLIVTEGSWIHKFVSIKKSAYLSYAYKTLADYSPRRFVIFGHSLAEQDSHIIRALNKWAKPLIAISVLPSTPDEVIAKKLHYRRQLPAATLLFFDAATHPLGK